MSEARSAVQGASSQGIVEVAEAGLVGMVTLRGDLSDKAFKDAVKSVAGVAVPKQRKLSKGKTDKLLWMSPDELLLFVPDSAAAVAGFAAALDGHHHMCRHSGIEVAPDLSDFLCITNDAFECRDAELARAYR